MESKKIIINATKRAMVKHPNKVLEYSQGKKTLLGLFIHEVNHNTMGMFDPNFVYNVVKEELEK